MCSRIVNPPLAIGERQAAREELSGTLDLEADKIAHTCARFTFLQRATTDRESLHVLQRHVATAPPQIDAEILPEVGELERRADRVGERPALLVVISEQRQDQTPDRVRRVAAIFEQIGESGERLEGRVVAKRAEQRPQRIDRQIALADRLAEGDEHRMGRHPAQTRVELCLPAIEHRELLGRR
jgi:hypothetical protein